MGILEDALMSGMTSGFKSPFQRVEDNPFHNIGVGLAGVDSYIPGGGFGENLLATLGTQGLGSLFGALGQRQVQEQNDRMTDILMQLSKGELEQSQAIQQAPTLKPLIAMSNFEQAQAEAQAAEQRRQNLLKPPTKVTQTLEDGRKKEMFYQPGVGLLDHMTTVHTPRSQNTNVTVINPADTRSVIAEMSKDHQKEVMELQGNLEQIDDISSQLQALGADDRYKKNPKLLNSAYYSIAGKYFPGSDEARANSAFMELLNTRVKALTGAAATLPEVARVKQSLQGGNLPNPADMAVALREVAKRDKRRVRNLFKSYENPAAIKSLANRPEPWDFANREDFLAARDTWRQQSGE